MIEVVDSILDEQIENRKKVSHTLANVYEFFKPYLFVSYVVSLEGKNVTASLYLKDKKTERKFVVGTGTAAVFFEETFVLATGEHWSYLDAVKDAETKLREYAAFNIFLNESSFKSSMFEDFNLSFILNRFQKNDGANDV